MGEEYRQYNPLYPVVKPLNPKQQYIQSDDGSWIRLTNPGMEAVVTARRPNVESDEQYTARRIAETQPKRTWLSDAADIFHTVGEAAMASDPYTAVPYFGARVVSDLLNNNVGLNTVLNGVFALTPFKQLPQFTLTPITDTAKGVVYGSKKLADKLGFFVQKPGTYTRGIGMTDAGVRDAVETGVFRGNPRGTEQTAKVFDKMFLKNRNNFRDIVKDTRINGIESRYQSRTLTEEDFNALKQASKKYDRTDTQKQGISLLPQSSDPLYKYKSYQEYLDDVLKTVRETNKMPKRIASGEIDVNNNLTDPMWFEDESGKMFLPQGKPISERFGPNSDYVSDGNPLSYWYGDGRNAITDGHAYARSNYMVRVNNPQDYIPFMHELHMHPSFFKTPKLSDPNVELFRRGPFGLTIRMRKPTKK